MEDRIQAAQATDTALTGALSKYQRQRSEDTRPNQGAVALKAGSRLNSFPSPIRHLLPAGPFDIKGETFNYRVASVPTGPGEIDTLSACVNAQCRICKARNDDSTEMHGGKPRVELFSGTLIASMFLDQSAERWGWIVHETLSDWKPIHATASEQASFYASIGEPFMRFDHTCHKSMVNLQGLNATSPITLVRDRTRPDLPPMFKVSSRIVDHAWVPDSLFVRFSDVSKYTNSSIHRRKQRAAKRSLPRRKSGKASFKVLR
jgi:hypothetical protein